MNLITLSVHLHKSQHNTQTTEQQRFPLRSCSPEQFLSDYFSQLHIACWFDCQHCAIYRLIGFGHGFNGRAWGVLIEIQATVVLKRVAKHPGAWWGHWGKVNQGKTDGIWPSLHLSICIIFPQNSLTDLPTFIICIIQYMILKNTIYNPQSV